MILSKLAPRINPPSARVRFAGALCFPCWPMEVSNEELLKCATKEGKPVFSARPFIGSKPPPGSLLISSSTRDLEVLTGLGKAEAFDGLKKHLKSTNLGGAEVVLGIMAEKISDLEGSITKLEKKAEASEAFQRSTEAIQNTGSSVPIIVYECIRGLESRLTRIYKRSYKMTLDGAGRNTWDKIVAAVQAKSGISKPAPARGLSFAKAMSVLHLVLTTPETFGLDAEENDFVIDVMEPLYRGIVADYSEEEAGEDAQLVRDYLAPADPDELLQVLQEWDRVEQSGRARNKGGHASTWFEGEMVKDEQQRLELVKSIFAGLIEGKSELVSSFPMTSRVALIHLTKYIRDKAAEAQSKAAAASSSAPAGKAGAPSRHGRRYGSV